ncbi:MAG: DNA/RNA nuclease SfsA [Candidatus Thorarchaeota archaeon]
MNDRSIEIDGEIFFAKFIERPNRFLVKIIIENSKQIEAAFLHDPGRMKELLLPNSTLVIRKAISIENRKTSWDVLGVIHNERLIVINSSYPNVVAKEALSKHWIAEVMDYELEKSEISVGKSRLDFLLKKGIEKAYVEVKGVTLVKDYTAFFPDAPTSRGTRHLQELIELKKKGFRALILFACMRNDAKKFSPNWDTDPDFSKQLAIAIEAGVEALVYLIEPKIIRKKIVLFFQNKIKIDI